MCSAIHEPVAQELEMIENSRLYSQQQIKKKNVVSAEVVG
jgi:hypothetical protein